MEELKKILIEKCVDYHTNHKDKNTNEAWQLQTEIQSLVEVINALKL